MGGYIRMDKDLEDDPRVLALAEAIGESLGLQRTETDEPHPMARNAALGALYRFWRYGDTHVKRDDRVTGALRMLTSVTGLSVTLLRSISKDWLKEHADGTVELPDFTAKNSLMDKDNRREKNRLRQAKHRANVKARLQGNGVTLSHVSKRDESVTPNPLPSLPDPNPKTSPSASLGVTPTAPASRKSFEEDFTERFGNAPRLLT
jgi:lambda repressor-like predicted transcriptional regulator